MPRYFNSKLLTSILSAAKTGLQGYCDTSLSMGGAKIRSGFIKIEGSVRVRTFNQCPAPHAIALSIWLLYPLHNYSPLKKRSKALVHLCLTKHIQTHCLRKGYLPKSSLKLISSICASFWLTIYLLCLVDVFFNRQSAFLSVPTALHFSPTCSFICTRLTSYRSFSPKTKRS